MNQVPSKHVLPVARPDPEVVAMLTSGLTASIALEKVILHVHMNKFCHLVCLVVYFLIIVLHSSLNKMMILQPSMHYTLFYSLCYLIIFCEFLVQTLHLSPLTIFLFMEFLGWTNGIWKSSFGYCCRWRNRTICSPGLLSIRKIMSLIPPNV